MKPATILIIDDQPDSRIVLQQVINDYLTNCKVIPAVSAQEGFQIIAETPVDLALIDWQMPDMDGMEMCRRLKEDGSTRDFLILLMTAHKTTAKLRAEALQVGADDFIVKPIDNLELTTKIKAMLRIKSAEDQLRRMNTELEKRVAERTYELKKSEERFADIAELCREIIWETDAKGLYTYVSQAFTSLLGYTKTEAEYRLHVYDLHPENGREEFRRRFLAVFDRQEAFIDLYNQIVAKDGRVFDVITNGIPIVDKNRGLLGYRGSDRDITELKQHEEEREMTLNLMRLLNSGNDKQSLIQTVTYFLQQWTGCDAVGIRLQEGEDFPYYETRGFSSEFVKAENRLCSRDAQQKIIRDSQGNPVLECMCGNILRGRFNPQLPFFTPNGSFWTNNTTKLLASTSEAERQSRTRNRCNGEGYESVALIPLRFGKKVLGLLQFNDRRPDRFTREKIIFLERSADSIATALEQRITSNELKESEKKKETLQAQLLQTQKLEALGMLAGGIAHDFNNILFAIIGYTELAIQNVCDPQSALVEKLQMVLKAAERAKNLVQQILTFSRKSDVNMGPLSLAGLVKEVLKLLRSTLPSTIEIKQNLENTSAIFGNPTQIHQILMNLCTNAAHAMRDQGGILEIGLREMEINESVAVIPYFDCKPGHYACLRVKDTGHGIDPSIQDRIFDPFFTTKEKSEGTGLGLSVVLGIVKSHQGFLSLDSAPGVGTEFKIYLPIVSAPIVENNKNERLLPGRGERVLIVDDEEALVQMNTHILNKLGYRVIAHTGSLEALETFRSNPMAFDLILTDQTMPKMKGTQLAQEILKIRADIPIILCTGYDQRLEVEPVKEMGIRELIMKPFTMQELASSCAKVLAENRIKPRK